MFKRLAIFGSLLTVAGLLTSSSIQASPKVDAGHRELYQAVERSGVDISLNDSEFCKAEGVSGLYFSANPGLMVICQATELRVDLK